MAQIPCRTLLGRRPFTKRPAASGWPSMARRCVRREEVRRSYRTSKVVNILVRELRGRLLRKEAFHAFDVREVSVDSAGSLDVQDGVGIPASRPDATDRGPMVFDRRSVCRPTDHTSRRQAAHSLTALSGRHSVGAAIGRSLERLTTGVSLLCHMLAKVAGLDRSRAVAEDLGTTGADDQRSPRPRLARPRRRRHVCAGQKGEQVCPPTNAGGGRVDAVGHHRRGRHGVGTTLLVLMDASRTPLAVEMAPANQHEVHLIEPLPDRAVVDLPAQRLPLVYDKAAAATTSATVWTRLASIWSVRIAATV